MRSRIARLGVSLGVMIGPQLPTCRRCRDDNMQELSAELDASAQLRAGSHDNIRSFQGPTLDDEIRHVPIVGQDNALSASRISFGMLSTPAGAPSKKWEMVTATSLAISVVPSGHRARIPPTIVGCHASRCLRRRAWDDTGGPSTMNSKRSIGRTYARPIVLRVTGPSPTASASHDVQVLARSRRPRRQLRALPA